MIILSIDCIRFLQLKEMAHALKQKKCRLSVVLIIITRLIQFRLDLCLCYCHPHYYKERVVRDSSAIPFFYGPHCSHLSFLIKIISPLLTNQSQYVANRSSRLYLLQCSLPPYHTTTITIGQYIDLIYNVRNMYANYV